MTLSELKKNIGSQQSVVCNVFVAEEMTSNQKPYLKIRLSDENSATIMVWNNDPNYGIIKAMPLNKLFKAKAEITFAGVNSSGYEEYILHTLEELPDLTKNCVDVEKLKEELKQIIMNIKDNDLRNLLYAMCKDTELLNKLFHAPGSEQSAYAFDGGTLAHVVRLCKLCDAVGPVFDTWGFNNHNIKENVNVDFLKTVSILHDLGRAVTYTINADGVVEKTFEGKMLSVTELSLKLLHEIIAKNKLVLRDEQMIMLEHAIASSAGTLSLGALSTPRMRDAIVFGFIEKMDVVIGNFEHMGRVSVGEEFQKLLDKQYCILNFEDV